MLLFVVFFIAAAGEELGWTALAQEKLQQQYGPLKAALIIGVLWSAWHVLPWLQVGRSLA
ncbi:MAG: CPBP family intramembrane metalloprotease [Candidatus Aminicenantes bacterium]|nr:CPBP family intramembrane metalloprotease [Candidatus Aminicenantes bacterium]